MKAWDLMVSQKSRENHIFPTPQLITHESLAVWEYCFLFVVLRDIGLTSQKSVSIHLTKFFLTINTPVRKDYQLSKEAQKRVSHVNVYDNADPVQIRGGNKYQIEVPVIGISPFKPFGEFGPAGRQFTNALNIPVDNPQNEFMDWHNSHNRIFDWFYKTEFDNFSITPNGPLFEYRQIYEMYNEK